MIRNVLVTGGAGYVGAVLVPKLLRAGFLVTVFDTYWYGDVFNGIIDQSHLKQIKADLRDYPVIKQALTYIDVVIHLACISNDPSFELNQNLGKSINYDATIQLFDSAQKAGVRRFIYASTSSVYGIKKESEVTEDLTLEPLTDYSKYKALSELELLKKSSENFTTLVVRPATVCGYSPRLRLDLTVNILTLHALVNNQITVFGGSQLRPNIHIEDITDLYVKTLKFPDKQINGKIFNVGYENHSLQDIAELVKKTLADPSITIITKPTSDLRSYKISSAKIKQELGFMPIHTIADAIQDLQTAYRTGKIPDALTDDRDYNIKTMKKLAAKSTL